MKVTINTIADLKDVAAQLLGFAGTSRFFIFNGAMGAGKTTFIKAFCAAIGVDDVVTSPTFSIVNEYNAGGNPVYHFDFYRLKSIAEAYDIGYEEYFYSDNYCLVEWPEKVEELLPEDYISVQIAIISDDERAFTFERHGKSIPVL